MYRNPYQGCLKYILRHYIYYILNVNRIPSLDISISYYAFIVILLTYEFLLHGKDDDEEVEQSD